MDCENCARYEDERNSAMKEAEKNDDNYCSAMSEVNRLRGVARQYGYFYDKIKEALENQDWSFVETALKEHE